jgi:hypothetical protein
LSGGGLAWVAANGGAAAIGNAINGQNGATDAASAAAAAPSAAANVADLAGKANALRGLSGGGAAFVGANLAVGALGKKSEAEAAAAPPASQEMTDAMKSSLLKTSVDSGKFADAYGLVSLQTQEYTALAEAAKKLD